MITYGRWLLWRSAAHHQVATYHLRSFRLEAAARAATRAAATATRARTRGIAANSLLVDELMILAEAHYRRGRYEAARDVLRQGEAAADALPDSERRRIPMLVLRGILSKDLGRYADAADCYQDAERSVITEYGENSIQHAILLHNYAGLAFAQRALPQAERYARQGLASRRVDTTCPTDCHGAADIAQLAAIVYEQGRVQEADRLYNAALGYFSRADGENGYEIAVNLHGLAAIAASRRRWDEAATLLRTALDLKTRLLGTQHPETTKLTSELTSVVKRK